MCLIAMPVKCSLIERIWGFLLLWSTLIHGLLICRSQFVWILLTEMSLLMCCCNCRRVQFLTIHFSVLKNAKCYAVVNLVYRLTWLTEWAIPLTLAICFWGLTFAYADTNIHVGAMLCFDAAESILYKFLSWPFAGSYVCLIVWLSWHRCGVLLWLVNLKNYMWESINWTEDCLVVVKCIGHCFC